MVVTHFGALLALGLAATFWTPPHEGNVWMLSVLLTLLATPAAWITALVHLPLEAHRLDRRHDRTLALVVFLAGLFVGFLALVHLWHGEPTTIFHSPHLYSAAVTGIGVGVMGAWSLLAAWVGDNHDAGCRAEAEAARDAMGQRVHAELETAALRSQLHKIEAGLHRQHARPSPAEAQCSSEERRRLRCLRELGMEVVSSALRMLTSDSSGPVSIHTQNALKSLTSAHHDWDEAAISLARTEVVEQAVPILAAAGPPVEALAEPNEAKGNAPRLQILQTNIDPLLRRIVGYDSVHGPRWNTAPMIHALILGVVAFLAIHLPSAGFREGWMLVPLVLPALVYIDAWATRSSPANGPHRLAHVLFALGVGAIGLYWWSLQGRHFELASEQWWGRTFVTGLAFLGGWPLGQWWVQQAQVRAGSRPLIPHAEGPRLDGLSHDLHRWRGELMTKAWLTFFTHQWQAWVNQHIHPLLQQTLPRDLLAAIDERLLSLRDRAFEQGPSSPAFHETAMAFRSLEALARWNVALQHLQELMLDEDYEAHASDTLERLATDDETPLRRWLEDREGHGADEGSEGAWMERFSRENLHLPRTGSRDTGLAPNPGQEGI